MLSINTNISSLIAQSSMKTSTNRLNLAIERMSTGFKINHAKDNAANYSISTNMTTKIGAYEVAEDNASMGLDMLTTAQDNIAQMQTHAERLRTLAIQARNGTYGESSLNAIQSEARSITKEIERLYSTAKYNGVSLLNRTEYDIPDHLPKAGKSGFIDESSLSEYALRRDEDDLFIDNPITYTQAEVEAMTPINEFDLTKSKKYKITSAEDLAKLAEIVNSGTTTQNAVFVLSQDIDLKSWCDKNGNWIPIGDYSTNTTNVFRGTFDGNGHTISNLKIDEPTKDYQGLFGVSSGTVKNIALVESIINGKGRVGVLVGDANYGSTINCHVQGSVVGSGNQVGGLVGRCGSTKYCNADVDVSGTGSYYGGLAGFGGATNCYAIGNVSVKGSYIGGLTGYSASILNSYATGDVNVTGGSRQGGLVGTSGNVKNCYATGDLTGAGDWSGGLVGEYATIKNSFSTGNITASGYYGTGGLGGQLYGTCNVSNSYATGQINRTSNTSRVGGLLGTVAGTAIIDSCYFFGKTTSNNIGGLIGEVKIADNATNFDDISIINCHTKLSEQDLIKRIIYNNGSVVNFDKIPLLQGISDVNILDTNINLQIGVNGNGSSWLSFAPKLEFDISTIYKDLKSGKSLNQIDELINQLNKKEVELGAAQNRLESVLEEITIQRDNLVSSRSTIRDADIADESSRYIQQQILQQASATLLATANQSPAIALQLI